MGKCHAPPACFVSTRTFSCLSTSIHCIPIASTTSATSCAVSLLGGHVCCRMGLATSPNQQTVTRPDFDARVLPLRRVGEVSLVSAACGSCRGVARASASNRRSSSPAFRSLHQASRPMKHPTASTASSWLRSPTFSALASGAARFAFSSIPELRSLSSRFRLLHLSRSATEECCSGSDLPRKCPTRRTAGSGVLPGFLRTHASSNGVASSASGCRELPLSSMLVALAASVPTSIGCCIIRVASEENCCGFRSLARVSAPILIRGRPAALRARRRHELSTNPAAVSRLWTGPYARRHDRSSTM